MVIKQDTLVTLSNLKLQTSDLHQIDQNGVLRQDIIFILCSEWELNCFENHLRFQAYRETENQSTKECAFYDLLLGGLLGNKEKVMVVPGGDAFFKHESLWMHKLTTPLDPYRVVEEITVH